MGKDWLGYLLNDPLTPFRIRIRENHKLRHGRRGLKASVVFQDLKPGQHRVLRDKRQLWGYWVYIVALRLDDQSLLVVATQTAPQSAITDYAKRWSIETLFGIFKTRGFCLESTHLIDFETDAIRVASKNTATYSIVSERSFPVVGTRSPSTAAKLPQS